VRCAGVRPSSRRGRTDRRGARGEDGRGRGGLRQAAARGTAECRLQSPCCWSRGSRGRCAGAAYSTRRVVLRGSAAPREELRPRDLDRERSGRFLDSLRSLGMTARATLARKDNRVSAPSTHLRAFRANQLASPRREAAFSRRDRANSRLPARLSLET